MAKSTAFITDVTTVITNGANAATTAKAIAAGGPIQDYVGNLKNLQTRLNLTTVLLAAVISVTDSTDSANLALLNGLQALLKGTSGPSTQALTDIKTVIANGPNAATTVKATRATGPIMDYPGNVTEVQLRLQAVARSLGSANAAGLIAVTDSTDSANLALLQNILLALV